MAVVFGGKCEAVTVVFLVLVCDSVLRVLAVVSETSIRVVDASDLDEVVAGVLDATEVVARRTTSGEGGTLAAPIRTSRL